MDKLKLYGFNNLTKMLSFNMYEFRFALSEDDKLHFMNCINEKYSAARLIEIMSRLTDIIGAQILNIAKQDYEPQGASASFLIAEDELPQHKIDGNCRDGAVTPTPHHIIGHLDKSHISIHTYPETHPHSEIMSLRADIDVTTCGKISPLTALDYLIEVFCSDVVICDYHIRGFTRDLEGGMHFRDHSISSIQDFISAEHQRRFTCADVNLHKENMFHTKMMVKELNADDYLLTKPVTVLREDKKTYIRDMLCREMRKIAFPE